MILMADKYVQEGADEQDGLKESDRPLIQLAELIARLIVKQLDLTPTKLRQDDSFLFEDGGWMEPGPPVDLADVRRRFDGSVVRPGDAWVPRTMADIIKAGWKGLVSKIQ